MYFIIIIIIEDYNGFNLFCVDEQEATKLSFSTLFYPVFIQRNALTQIFVFNRVMLSTAELHWESSGFSTALPLLLQALALARQHHLQSLASETVLHLAFTQVRLQRNRHYVNTVVVVSLHAN